MRATELEDPRGAWCAWHRDDAPIRIGVSGCLLGEAVRYDGGHKRDAWLVEVLGPRVEWVSVCPEVELGMGVPRPTVRLVEVAPDQELRMLSPETGEDFTERMQAFSRARVAALPELDGYVLKRNSPSCGMAGVQVFGFAGPQGRDGVGLFARELLAARPQLPVEEEGRLAEPALRESFVERVFCRNRWRTLVAAGRSRDELREFWSVHELQVRAHDEAACRTLGELVGSARKGGTDELFRRFEAAFFGALSRKATTARHAGVLRHALGRLREHLDAGERAQLAAALAAFRAGRLPLVVPLSLWRFQIEKHRVEALLPQLYFDPHPGERMLRNRV